MATKFKKNNPGCANSTDCKCAATSCVLFTDDFHRPNVGNLNTGGTINYTVTGSAQISNNTAVVSPGANVKITANQASPIASGYTVYLDFTATSDGDTVQVGFEFFGAGSTSQGSFQAVLVTGVNGTLSIYENNSTGFALASVPCPTEPGAALQLKFCWLGAGQSGVLASETTTLAYCQGSSNIGGGILFGPVPSFFVYGNASGPITATKFVTASINTTFDPKQPDCVGCPTCKVCSSGNGYDNNAWAPALNNQFSSFVDQYDPTFNPNPKCLWNQDVGAFVLGPVQVNGYPVICTTPNSILRCLKGNNSGIPSLVVQCSVTILNPLDQARIYVNYTDPSNNHYVQFTAGYGSSTDVLVELYSNVGGVPKLLSAGSNFSGGIFYNPGNSVGGTNGHNWQISAIVVFRDGQFSVGQTTNQSAWVTVTTEVGTSPFMAVGTGNLSNGGQVKFTGCSTKEANIPPAVYGNAPSGTVRNPSGCQALMDSCFYSFGQLANTNPSPGSLSNDSQYEILQGTANLGQVGQNFAILFNGTIVRFRQRTRDGTCNGMVDLNLNFFSGEPALPPGQSWDGQEIRYYFGLQDANNNYYISDKNVHRTPGDLTSPIDNHTALYGPGGGLLHDFGIVKDRGQGFVTNGICVGEGVIRIGGSTYYTFDTSGLAPYFGLGYNANPSHTGAFASFASLDFLKTFNDSSFIDGSDGPAGVAPCITCLRPWSCTYGCLSRSRSGGDWDSIVAYRSPGPRQIKLSLQGFTNPSINGIYYLLPVWSNPWSDATGTCHYFLTIPGGSGGNGIDITLDISISTVDLRVFDHQSGSPGSVNFSHVWGPNNSQLDCENGWTDFQVDYLSVTAGSFGWAANNPVALISSVL